MNAPRRVLVSGGPGVGKSTLLQALAAHGLAVAGDAARQVIQERRLQGLPPRGTARDFADNVLQRGHALYDALRGHAGDVLFDSGLPDALALRHEAHPFSEAEIAAELACRPHARQVLFLPPWAAIHTTDAERDGSFAHTLAVHDRLRAWYLRLGFVPVDLPRATLAQRVAFVLRFLDEG